MRIRNVMIIGLLVLVVLAIPVMAGEETAQAVVNSDVGTKEAQEVVQAPPVAGIVINPTGYLYMFNHGNGCVPSSRTDPDWNGVWPGTPGWSNSGQGFLASLDAATAGDPTQWVDIDCPVLTAASFTSRHMYIRYGLIQMRGQTNLGGRITSLNLYSGDALLRTMAVNYYSNPNGALMEYNVDMGQWYDFVRGMNWHMRLTNTDTLGTRYIRISGIGARGDWV